MSFALTFPAFDPVAISIGPLAIRWYGLAYVAGLLLAWRYCLRLARLPPRALSVRAIDDFLFWATLGVILGGRLGYVLFYKPGFYFANPLEILIVWGGGMSFHGGLLGVLAAMVLFARKLGVRLVSLADIVCAAAPIGLFLGRIANFVNGELFGRTTEAPWGIVFPNGGPLPRHPSQIYEAFLEGLVLFAVLHLLVRRGALERGGALSGVFLIGYAASRLIVELFREPDAHLRDLFTQITLGQILSLPMLLLGIFLLYRSRPARP